jgi:hypothetical protein
MQLGMLLIYWLLVWMCAMVAHRPWKEPDAGIRYLWWMSAPMFGLFLAFSVRTNGGEPNWPVTAYLSGLVLAAGWLANQLRSPSFAWRRLTYAAVSITCVVGLTLTMVAHFSRAAQPILKLVSGAPSPQHPMPLRRFDPTCRLRGWRYLASEVDRVKEMLKAEGDSSPIIAGNGWTIPGELTFYCDGHPKAYTLGVSLGDRYSQFDLWHPSPVWDPATFAGKTFILVGNESPVLTEGFAKEITAYPVLYTENGEPIACWKILVCRGFKQLTIPKWVPEAPASLVRPY